LARDRGRPPRIFPQPIEYDGHFRIARGAPPSSDRAIAGERPDIDRALLAAIGAAAIAAGSKD
jgi:hypothetical protein